MTKIAVRRNWSNTISGWFIACLVTGMTVAVDPLGVHVTWKDGGQGWTGTNVLILGWFFLLSLGSFAIFARPRVEIYSEGIWIRGVVRDVFIPPGALDQVDPSTGQHLRIQAQGQTFEVAATERSNLDRIIGRPGAAGAVAADAEKLMASPSTDGPTEVQKTWRRPEVSELLFVAVWLMYVVMGIAGVRFR